jgi:hypothetical protein
MGTQRIKPSIAYTLILRRFPLESNVLAAKECFFDANGAKAASGAQNPSGIHLRH